MGIRAPEDWDHRYFGLKKGDIAYLVLEPGIVNEITITGPCGDGHGYEALKACSFGYPYVGIHTCNRYLSPMLSMAQREAFRQLVKEKDDLVRRIGDMQPSLAALQDRVGKGWRETQVISVKKGFAGFLRY